MLVTIAYYMMHTKAQHTHTPEARGTVAGIAALCVGAGLIAGAIVCTGEYALIDICSLKISMMKGTRR